MPTISLPTRSRRLEPYTTGEPLDLPPRGSLPVFNRVAYAAAHVVADPLADINPWLDAAIDWERTVAFRHYLWDLGLGVAEAMDTAQRGMGLDWAGARELISRTLEAAEVAARRAHQLRSWHRPSPRWRRHNSRRCRPRVRGAERSDRTYGRQAHRHGEPRTCSGCQGDQRNTPRSTIASSLRCDSRSSCTGSARCSIQL